MTASRARRPNRWLTSSTSRFVFRDQLCEHVVIVAGRCLASEGDLVIGEQTAKKFHVAPGDTITLTYAQHVTRPSPAAVRGPVLRTVRLAAG